MTLAHPDVWVVLFGSLFAFSLGTLAQDAISRGTILPVRLESSFSLKTKPGKVITARVMQDVPPSNGTKIREWAKVVGHVIAVVSPTAGAPAQISFEFDQLVVSGRKIPVSTSLRAIASYVEVEQAQIPQVGLDPGTQPITWTTRQVGGDIVYRPFGPVTADSTIVGELTYDDGVLARLHPQPGSKCADTTDSNTPQALWVFSADACGTYGFTDVTIAHAGRSDPRGEITLASTNSKLRILSGSGMLLQVMSRGSRNSF